MIATPLSARRPPCHHRPRSIHDSSGRRVLLHRSWPSAAGTDSVGRRARLSQRRPPSRWWPFHADRIGLEPSPSTLERRRGSPRGPWQSRGAAPLRPDTLDGLRSAPPRHPRSTLEDPGDDPAALALPNSDNYKRGRLESSQFWHGGLPFLVCFRRVLSG